MFLFNLTPSLILQHLVLSQCKCMKVMRILQPSHNQYLSRTCDFMMKTDSVTKNLENKTVHQCEMMSLLLALSSLLVADGVIQLLISGELHTGIT